MLLRLRVLRLESGEEDREEDQEEEWRVGGWRARDVRDRWRGIVAQSVVEGESVDFWREY